MVEGVCRRRLIQKDGDGPVRGGPRKWVGFENRRHFVWCTDNDADRSSSVGVQAPFKRRLDLRRRLFGGEDQIAASNVSLDLRKGFGEAHRPQLSHGQLSGSTHIYSTQQRNVGRHFTSFPGAGGLASPKHRREVSRWRRFGAP